MKFRNLTTDDRFIVGVGLAKAGTAAPHEDGPVTAVEPGPPFDLPEGFDIAGIAHQDVYEAADDEAVAAVAALLAQIAADEDEDAPEEVVVPAPKDLPADPAVTDPATDQTPEQENTP